MPPKLQYDAEKNILKITVHGSLSFEEFNGIGQEIANSTEYPPDTNALWDLRKADFSNINSSTLNQYLYHASKFRERGSAKVAFIIGDEASFGLMRMYEMLSDSKLAQLMRVFRDYEKGENWLLR